MTNRLFAILATFFLSSASSVFANDKYVLIVDSDLKAMIYKRGLILNEWKPYKVHGFAIGGKTMSFEEFAEQYYVEEKNELWKIEGHLGTKTNRVCKMYSRSTYEGERLQFYVGEGDARRYIVFDDREDYLKFRCQKQ